MQGDSSSQSSDLVLLGCVRALLIADICIVTFSDEIDPIVLPQSQHFELRSFAS